jgi:hypothetical protein
MVKSNRIRGILSPEVGATAVTVLVNVWLPLADVTVASYVAAYGGSL